jgi:hypothetical protein
LQIADRATGGWANGPSEVHRRPPRAPGAGRTSVAPATHTLPGRSGPVRHGGERCARRPVRAQSQPVQVVRSQLLVREGEPDACGLSPGEEGECAAALKSGPGIATEANLYPVGLTFPRCSTQNRSIFGSWA